MTRNWTNPIVDGHESYFINEYSPSATIDNIKWKLENKYRFIATHLLQHACRLLKMPQSAAITGSILIHQFYCQQSLQEYPIFYISMATTFLVGKVEECHRRCRDVINVFWYLYGLYYNQEDHLKEMKRQSFGNERKRTVLISEKLFGEWKTAILTLETHILRSLSFVCTPASPLPLLPNYLNALQLHLHPKLGQLSMNYLNDSLKSVASVCWQPHAIVCTCIQMASDDCHEDLPEDWQTVFGCQVDGGDIKGIKRLLENVYLLSNDWLRERSLFPKENPDLFI